MAASWERRERRSPRTAGEVMGEMVELVVTGDWVMVNWAFLTKGSQKHGGSASSKAKLPAGFAVPPLFLDS